MESAEIRDFSGGLDLVSSLSDVPDGFTPSARNFRIAEAGGIEKVLGYSAHATLSADGIELTAFKQRDGSPNLLVAATATTVVSIDSGGTVTSLQTGRTTDTDVRFAAYEDELYWLSANNDLAKWDGTTVTTYAPGANTGPNQGIILGIWDNRMWTSPGGLRVEWSEAGTLTGTASWPTTNFIELGGPGSTEEIVGGMPVADGILIFTTGSTYRIYDAVDQLSTTVDPSRGLTSHKSLVQVGGLVYGMCEEGLFVTDGNSPLRIVSDRVRPLFADETPTLSTAASVDWFGSVLTSYARLAGVNDLTLDFSTHTGSIMVNEYPAHAWARSDMDGNPGAYFIDASDKTRIRKAFDGGSFAGTDITCFYVTAPYNLGAEPRMKRMRKARVVGRGDLTMEALVDYSEVPTESGRLDFPDTSGSNWDAVNWDAFLWGGYELFEGWAQIAARGRDISLKISETSSETAPTRSTFGSSTGDTLGGAGVYLIEPHFHLATQRR